MKSFRLLIAGVMLAAVCLVARISPSVAIPAGQAAHHVGQTFAYVLHGHMAQSIDGHDPFGQKIHQSGAPAVIDGNERIAIKGVSPATGDLTLRRTGSVVATVSGRHNKPMLRSGWTVLSTYGTIVRDNNKLGGVFLLPLPFLGDRAVRAGLTLTVGDSWEEKFGVKLFGMLAAPDLRYQVTSSSMLLGKNIFTITGSGSVPMKEPIVTNAGYALGEGIGTAWLTLKADYDPVNRRMVSMNVEVRDTLQLFGPNKKVAGTVRDRQRYDVALDAVSLMAGARPGPSTDAGSGSDQP